MRSRFVAMQLGWVVTVLAGCGFGLPDPVGIPGKEATPADIALDPIPSDLLPGDAGTPLVEEPTDACQPLTCRQLAISCGTVADGCEGTLDCGDCEATPAEVVGRRCDPVTGWCWENYPAGAAMRAIVAFAPDQAWTVGEGGTAQRWNGKRWLPYETHTTRDLNALWGSGPDELVAVGDSGVWVVWDGTAFRPQARFTTDHLVGIDGTSASDLWVMARAEPTAYSQTGSLWHRTASGWLRVELPPGPYDLVPSPIAVDAVAPAELVVLTVGGGTDSRCLLYAEERWTDLRCPGGVSALRAFSRKDIWTVIDDPTSNWGCVAHYDGTQWKEECMEPLGGAISGSAPDDVWISGDWHFDGTKWTRRYPDRWHPESLVIGGSSATDIWSGSQHFDGERWIDTRPGAWVGAASAAALASDGVYALTPAGEWAHWEGSWRTVATVPEALLIPAAPGVMGDSTDNVWEIGPVVRRLEGTKWVTHPGPFGETVRGAFLQDGAPTVTDGSAWWSWREGSWVQRSLPGGPTETGVTTRSGEIWMSHENLAERWDGARWRSYPVHELPDGVRVRPHAMGNAVWFTVNDYQTPALGPEAWSVWRWDGERVVLSKRAAVFGAASSDRDAWAVGITARYGAPAPLWHFDGARWTEFPPLPLLSFSWSARENEAVYAFSKNGGLFSRAAEPAVTAP